MEVTVRSTARDLRESAVQGLAKVGLVWSTALLGTFFVATTAAAAHASTRVQETVASVGSVGPAAPHQAGLALALTVLISGLAVLALGALRDRDAAVDRYDDAADRYDGHDLALLLEPRGSLDLAA
jgi:hypothetical protein